MCAKDHNEIMIKSDVLIKNIIKPTKLKFNLKAISFEEYFRNE